MNKIHYQCNYKFSKRINIFWRLAIGFPIMIFVGSYVFHNEINFPKIYLVFTAIIIAGILILIRYTTYKGVKGSDTYSFVVNDEKVSSIHPIEEHEMNFILSLKDIKSVSKTLSSCNASGDYSKPNYLINTHSGKVYRISVNFVDSPEKAYKAIAALLKTKDSL